MRKKLIDSTKADIKKYMMIVESAGKVPASTREDFELEDIENPYFQGDEDTEESEGNRYYVTVGVKIGYDENTDSYFPEVIWDQETGTEIEFDKLDKISKKSIQYKCDEIGSKMHVQRNEISEEYESIPSANKIKLGDYTEILDPVLSDFKIGMVIRIDADSYGKFNDKIGIIQTNGMNMISSFTKTRYKQFKAKMQGGDVIDVRSDDVTLYKPKNQISESTQIVVKALMQKFKISESKAKSIVAKVSESLIFENNQMFKLAIKLPNGQIQWVQKQNGVFQADAKNENDADVLSAEEADQFKKKYGSRFEVIEKPTTENKKKLPLVQSIDQVSISKELATQRRVTGKLTIKHLQAGLISVRAGQVEVCSFSTPNFKKLEFPESLVSVNTRLPQGSHADDFKLEFDEFSGTLSLKNSNNQEVLYMHVF